MNEIAILKRKLKLNRQAASLIEEEIQDLQIMLALKMIENHLAARMNKHYDPILSRKLDCVRYLIEN